MRGRDKEKGDSGTEIALLPNREVHGGSGSF